MYKFAVSLTKTAYRDVFAVYDYIAGESGDQVLAEREAMGLFTAAGELETFPLKYPVIRRKKFARFHIRKMAFGNYVIFYRVNLQHMLKQTIFLKTLNIYKFILCKILNFYIFINNFK